MHIPGRRLHVPERSGAPVDASSSFFIPSSPGLVAGAFILASLRARLPRRGRQAHLPPRACSPRWPFLLVAPLPLQLHLGHPERSLEMYLTPHRSSAMAMFGFVYLWYLMAVLLLEDLARLPPRHRPEISDLDRRNAFIYRVITLGSSNVSERSLHIDERLGYFITLVGIPSAFLLHGYVGFIFGSVKANPWRGNVLMPIIFVMSAMVSGIAAVMLLYMLLLEGCAAAPSSIRMRRRHRPVPPLRLRHRLQPRDARPAPAHLRGRRILPRHPRRASDRDRAPHTLPFIILWVLVKLLPPWPDAGPVPASGAIEARNQLTPVLRG